MPDALYPNQPGHKTDGASEDAAAAISSQATILRAAALQTLLEAPAGLTADEIARRLGKSPLSIRPRISELVRQGKVIRSGDRRRNRSGMTAHVWVATDATTQ